MKKGPVFCFIDRPYHAVYDVTNISVLLVVADVTCSGADGQAVVSEARPCIPDGAHHTWTPRLFRGSTELLRR